VVRAMQRLHWALIVMFGTVLFLGTSIPPVDDPGSAYDSDGVVTASQPSADACKRCVRFITRSSAPTFNFCAWVGFCHAIYPPMIHASPRSLQPLSVQVSDLRVVTSLD
jgi:hypothetical protein